MAPKPTSSPSTNSTAGPGHRCVVSRNPEFIFSYASGVGPVATSPGLSLSGTEIAYVENDPNIGAILHVLTFGSGSTEYGTSASCATNNNGGATLADLRNQPGDPRKHLGKHRHGLRAPSGFGGRQRRNWGGWSGR